MTLIRVDYHSDALGKYCQMNVLMPDCPDPANPPKVLYLLHGLSDNYHKWDIRSNVELYADGMNLCVVMPDGDVDFYSDNVARRSWLAISRDVPAFIEKNFCVSHKREDTYVAGLSMGGYGAVKLGLRMPEKFRRVFAMSSAVSFETNRRLFANNGVLFCDGTEHENDPKVILKDDLAAGKTLPFLHIYCGDADFLYQENTDFVEFLKENDVAHTFTVDPGCGHEWRYWDLVIGRALQIISEDGKNE